MALAALVVTLVAIAILSVQGVARMTLGYGDTDDAMRIVLMRGLLSGTGWYDQLVTRLQPPQGLQMHWSRLIDGGLAGLVLIFRLFVTPDRAEFAARFVWPLLWIFPTCWAALAASRRLAGNLAVFACAILLMTEMSLFLQFRPGRVDHHNLQIMLCMLAFAGAALGSVRGAAVSGLSIGLGLAIGLEALAFEVVIAAFFPLCFIFGKEGEARQLKAFAIALGVVTVGCFLIQTPPWRWGVSACDATAANITAAVGVAAVGLVASVRLTETRDWRWKLGALAVAGTVTLAVYLALDPNCVKGPFADVDARLKDFWLRHVQEIRPIPKVWGRDHETVYSLTAPMLMGGLAWLWLGRDKARRTEPFWILSGACLLAASVAGFSAIRMATYANWFAIPIVAAAVTDITDRYANRAMLVAAAAACVATPLYLAYGVTDIDKRIAAVVKPKAKPAPAPTAPKPVAKSTAAPKKKAPGGDRCFQIPAYAELAKLPPGLVLGEIDVGPFVLAYTPSSAMAAPYHRMSWGMLTGRSVMSAEAEAAQGLARRYGAAYVVSCAGHTRSADRLGMKPDSLQKRLDANRPPSWLEPVPVKGSLRLWRVKPASA